MQNTQIKIDGLTLYVKVKGQQATCKIGSRGKVEALPQVYGSMLKGESRKLRKQLRKAGFSAAAGIERAPAIIEL